jgi:hypothetical protein
MWDSGHTVEGVELVDGIVFQLSSLVKVDSSVNSIFEVETVVDDDSNWLLPSVMHNIDCSEELGLEARTLISGNFGV